MIREGEGTLIYFLRPALLFVQKLKLQVKVTYYYLNFDLLFTRVIFYVFYHFNTVVTTLIECKSIINQATIPPSKSELSPIPFKSSFQKGPQFPSANDLIDYLIALMRSFQ